jgi:hypothetical protein
LTSEHGDKPDDAKLVRLRIVTLMMIAAPVTIAFWFGIYHALPPVPGMVARMDRTVFALKCIPIAILLCFVTGVEAVAHERLMTRGTPSARGPRIDPDEDRPPLSAEHARATRRLRAWGHGTPLLLCRRRRDARRRRDHGCVDDGPRGLLDRYHRAPRFRGRVWWGWCRASSCLSTYAASSGTRLAGPSVRSSRSSSLPGRKHISFTFSALDRPVVL